MKNFFILCWIVYFTIMTIVTIFSGANILAGLLVWAFIGLIIPAAYLEF